jgi:sulfoxide reductase catalytic subunit YedY
MSIFNEKSTRFNSNLTQSDVTDESLFLKRRQFIKASMSLSAMAYFPQLAMAAAQDNPKYSSLKRTIDLDLESSSYKDITTYNNFYELGYGKGDPVANAAALKTEPWSVTIEGECERPGTFALEDILKPHNFEERLYRFRCVEAWSMVIPWAGFPLAELLKRFKPNSKAKYVAFETLYDERNPLPGQRRDVLAWPYREGLRMDEAMHPL